jgi:CheY-like chemotaxis protein
MVVRKNVPHPQSFEEARRPQKSPRILVAEDDREMRRILVAVLQKDGYEVLEAQDGFELLDYLGSPPLIQGRVTQFDMVISDIRMPVFSGMDVLSYLRDTDWKTPMILITAFGDQRTHTEAARLGATAVFDKPFSIDELRATVGRILPPT